MQLRHYQSTALAGVQAAYTSGRRRVLLVAPTGSGKSAMMRYMLERTSKRTLILCHRAELLDMISESLTVPHGIVGGRRGVPDEPVHVGMMQTVGRRLDTLPSYDWVISDEAHLAMCATWLGILQHYGRAWHLGLSATPCRLDGRGLGEHFDQIVQGPSIKELTERGYLVPCRVFAPANEGRDAKKSGGDFNMAEAAELLDRKAITGNAVAHYHKLAAGRQAIVFCCSREHADHVAREFTEGGIPAVNVDGAMSSSERDRRIGDFRGGRVRALINVDLLTTGFDCPQIQCGIFLRPTQSLALYLQMVGRILRIHDGKRDATLIDHVGNVLSHGLPDEDREWTLDGRPRAQRATSVRQCPTCYAAHAPAPKCPCCAHSYAEASAPRRALEQRDGELAEMTGDRLRQLREADLNTLLRAARTREALEEIRMARGYSAGWTYTQMKLRADYKARFGRHPVRAA